MYKILIADKSEDRCAILKATFPEDFQVTFCHDSDTARTLLKKLQPDALILDLSLPKTDGITLLMELGGHVPPATLAVADTLNAYMRQSALNLGVKHVMVRPFRNNAPYMHIVQMLQFSRRPAPKNTIADHLSRLGILPGSDGFNQLRLCIPRYAQDPFQRLNKELYPAVAALCGCESGSSLERSIRCAIKTAWTKRNPKIWEEYFPGLTQSPSNKLFIARFAEFVMPEYFY